MQFIIIPALKLFFAMNQDAVYYTSTEVHTELIQRRYVYGSRLPVTEYCECGRCLEDCAMFEADTPDTPHIDC